MLTRKEVAKDLILLAELKKKADDRSSEHRRLILSMQKKDQLLKTLYGKRYMARLLRMELGETYPQTCVICGRITPSDQTVCPICLNKLQEDPKEFAKELVPLDEENPFLAGPMEIDLEDFDEKPKPQVVITIGSGDEVSKAVEKTKVIGKKLKNNFGHAANNLNHKLQGIPAGEETDEALKGNYIDIIRMLPKSLWFLRFFFVFLSMFVMSAGWHVITLSPGAEMVSMLVASVLMVVPATYFFYELALAKGARFQRMEVFLLFLLGWGVSLVLSGAFHLIFTGVPENRTLAGMMEELFLMIATLLLLRQRQHDTGKWVNMFEGMLIGAAIGAGFSVFELMNTGAVLMETYRGSRLDSAKAILIMLAASVLSIGSHVAWNAVLGGAIAHLGRDQGSKWAWDQHADGIIYVFYPFLMHIWWVIPILNFGIAGLEVKQLVLMIVSLAIVNLMIHKANYEHKKQQKK
ncbi:MAG: PrsW family intramembrane metalloprotease [Lachnospiraceae bacterium]|nr:PrsW family intramembrane metalloprotease [Lachnospiraceae bacterium]